MFDSKIDKAPAPDQKPSEGPGLDSVKGHGDKLALLDALTTEGKLSKEPFQGPQAVLKEGGVSVDQIVLHSIEGAKTSDIEAIKALPTEMKISLMERVLEERPNTTFKEIRATCAVLEIDPEKFITASTEAATKDTQDQLKDAKTAKDLNNVVLNLFYREAEAVAVVDKNIELSIGKSIVEQFASKTSDVAQKLSLDLALLGQTLDPYLDLQRVLALLAIERGQAEKRAVPLSTAENIHIQRMEEALEVAAKAIEHQTKFPGDNAGGNLGGFYSALKDAQNHFANYQEAKPWWVRNPAAVRGLLIAIVIFILLFFFQDRNHPIIYWLTAGMIGFFLFNRSEKARVKKDDQLRKNAIDNYQTIAEKRAAARAARLRS